MRRLQPYRHGDDQGNGSANDGTSAPAESPQPPRIRVPVLGGGSLQAELVGVGYGLGAIVRGDVRRPRGQGSDLFILDGPMTLSESPHSLWVHVGTLAFRTDLAQLLALQDFIEEARRYAYDCAQARKANESSN